MLIHTKVTQERNTGRSSHSREKGRQLNCKLCNQFGDLWLESYPTLQAFDPPLLSPPSTLSSACQLQQLQKSAQIIAGRNVDEMQFVCQIWQSKLFKRPVIEWQINQTTGQTSLFGQWARIFDKFSHTKRFQILVPRPPTSRVELPMLWLAATCRVLSVQLSFGYIVGSSCVTDRPNWMWMAGLRVLSTIVNREEMLHDALVERKSVFVS